LSDVPIVRTSFLGINDVLMRGFCNRHPICAEELHNTLLSTCGQQKAWGYFVLLGLKGDECHLPRFVKHEEVLSIY
jgi:hypothetical protein